jgi:radical SAM-linked protein
LVLRISVRGLCSFLSQTEVVRLLDLAVFRSGLPFAYTGGYVKRLKIRLGPAWPRGVEALNDPLMLFLEKPVSPRDIKEALNACLPPCVRVREAVFSDAFPLTEKALWRAILPRKSARGFLSLLATTKGFLSLRSVRFVRDVLVANFLAKHGRENFRPPMLEGHILWQRVRFL